MRQFYRLPLVALVASMASGAFAQEGSTLRVATPGDPHSVDICSTGATATSRVILYNVAEGLTARVPGNPEAQPLLATSWKQVSENVWEFDLREDVTFQDGAAFDAEAAVTSFERSFVPELNCSADSFLPQGRFDVEATGPYRIRITTEVEDKILPLRLSFLGITSPNTPADRLSDTPVGTGPYSFVRWARASEIELKRHDGYWGEAPSIETVKFLIRPEDVVRAEMVGVGEADIVLGLPLEYASRDGAVTFDAPETVALRMHTHSKPFDDIRVREAVRLAIDREGLIAAIWGGFAVMATQPITPDVDGYDPSVPPPVYDPEKAKVLIAEAKADGVAVETPSTIDLRLDIVANGDLLAQALAEQLNAIGLNVRVETLEPSPWTDVMRSRPTDRPGFLLEVHNNTLGDASLTVNSKYVSRAIRSQVPQEMQATVDDMAARAAIAEGAERTRLYQELFAYLAENVVQEAFIVHPQAAMLLGPHVDYQPTAVSGDIFKLSDITLQN